MLFLSFSQMKILRRVELRNRLQNQKSGVGILALPFASFVTWD